jgi:excisionase family DNA binding protein
MARAQKKLKPTPPAASPTPEANGPMVEVLTPAEAATLLRVPEAEVLRLAREGILPGRQIGTDWRFLKAAVSDWLRAGFPLPLEDPLRANKEAWLAMAGKYKDDPDLEEIVEEAYRRRGRPVTEDGSYKNFSR